MNDKEAVESAVLSHNIAKHFSKEPYNYQCYFCGNAIDKRMFYYNEKRHYQYFQRGVKGVNHPICSRCFKVTSFFDEINTKVWLFIIGWRKKPNV